MSRAQGWRARTPAAPLAVVVLPLAFNELLWVLGETAYVVVHGRMGTDSLATMAMTFPVQSLTIGLLTGVADSAGCSSGNALAATISATPAFVESS